MDERESAVKMQLSSLCNENVIVRRGMDMHKYGRCTYTEALELIVIQLAAVQSQQFEALVQAQIRNPYPASVSK